VHAAATRNPPPQVQIDDAGHFQFLDEPSALQRAVCAAGEVDEGAVRRTSQAVMVAWAEIMLRDPGEDVLSTLQLSCEGRLLAGAFSGGAGLGLGGQAVGWEEGGRAPLLGASAAGEGEEAGGSSANGYQLAAAGAGAAARVVVGEEKEEEEEPPAAWQGSSDMERFLERMLARLRRQQGLHISSRFKNLA
jgi:hypothetical protein